MKINLKKYINLIPGFVVIFIFTMIYLIKGVYPFGKKTLLQGDLNLYVDTVTFLLNIIKNHTWKSLIFTNLIFSGNGNIILISWLNPFFLVYMLCLNTLNLMYFMSYIVVIKCILIVYSSYICFIKLFGKENNKWNILFSIIYTFSAYVLINHSTLVWLDIIALFPLIILSLKRVFMEYKFGWYSLLIGLCIIVNYQLSYMIIFSILATSILAIKIYNIENKKKAILSLGIGTIIGVMLSCMYLYPIAKIYIESARVGAQVIVNVSYWSTKLAYILLSSILFFGTLKSFKYRKDDKNILFLLCSILVTGIIPILFEGVNIIWHGGQYDSFPFRYGFIPLFFMVLVTIYYMKNYSQKAYEIKVEKIDQTIIIDDIVEIFLLIAISTINSISQPVFQIYPVTVFLLSYYIFWSFNIYKKLLSLKNEEISFKYISFFIIIEIIILSLGFFGLEPEYNGYEHSEFSTKKEIEIKNDLKKNLDFDSGYRYKDADNLLIEVSSFSIGVPTIESWNLSDNNQVYVHNKLGYSSLVLRLDSNGGTILSDAIMGNKYVFSEKKLNEEVYNYISKTNKKMKLYETKETFPFGIVYNSKSNIEKIPENLDIFDTQNWIYHNLFNKEDDIFSKLKLDEDYNFITKNVELQENEIIDFKKNNIGKYDKDCYIEYNINVPHKSVLYMMYDGEFDRDTYKTLYIENMKNSEWNKYYPIKDKYNFYPDYFNNGIVDLGIYENEIATIRLNFGKANKDFDINAIKFGLLDFEKYEQLNNNLIDTEFKCNQNSVSISVNSPDNNNSLFLPLVYDENIVATNNGQKIKVQRAMNGLISIPLKEGENRIDFTYTNPNIKVGLLITIIGIMLLIVLTLLREPILNLKLLQNIAYIIFILVTTVFYLYVYGYGIVSTFI